MKEPQQGHLLLLLLLCLYLATETEIKPDQLNWRATNCKELQQLSTKFLIIIFNDDAHICTNK